MKRYERQAARRYWHRGSDHRRCGVGLCFRCWWRTITGQHRRNKAALIARGKAHAEAVRNCQHDWQPRDIGGTVRNVCSRCHVIVWLVKR